MLPFPSCLGSAPLLPPLSSPPAVVPVSRARSGQSLLLYTVEGRWISPLHGPRGIAGALQPEMPLPPCPVSLLQPPANPFLHPPGSGNPPPLASLCEVSGGSGGSALASLRAHPALPPLQLAPLAYPLVPIGNGNHPILCLSLTPNAGNPNNS
jgi:hypothetical protein